MKNIILLIGLLTVIFSQSNAQNAASTLEDKINKSDAVVEGKVINGNVYGRWTDNFKATDGTYNSFIIRISKVFKGEIKDTIVELVISALPSSDNYLTKGYEGMFFLKQNNTTVQSGKNIQSFIYLYPSSFFRYQGGQPYFPITHDGTTRYDNLQKDLYPAIEAVTLKQPEILGQCSFDKK